MIRSRGADVGSKGGFIMASLLFVTIGVMTVGQGGSLAEFLAYAAVGAIIAALIFFILGFGGKHEDGRGSGTD